MAEQAKRLLVVDDHPFVREGLKQLLATQPEFIVVAEASGIADAQAAVATASPEIAVVDLTLATEDGTELIRWLRAHHPGIAILVLSMQDEALFAEKMLRLGVQGYVMKSAAAADFLTALRRVARGQKHVSAAISERLLAQVVRGRARDGDDPVAALTARELGIFRLIGSGISTREIAGQLTLSMKTVDAHRRHMREKLNLRSTSELIRYATQWVADESDPGNTDDAPSSHVQDNA
ncbi:MAG: response regulator transcription factor [Steroidobacteraceae bacterium]